MHAVDQLLASGFVHAIGWALIHFLWQGCVIAVIYWLVCVLSQRGSAHLRYWAGVGSLGLIVLVIGSTFALYLEPDARFIAAPAAPESVNAFLVLGGALPDARSLLQGGIEPALPVVVALWLAGVLILASRTALDWLRLHRLLQSSGGEAGEAISRSARRLEQQLGLRRAVRILQSARVQVPMAVGWIRPVILIPAAVLARLPQDQLEMVLAHELGHIRRCDHLVNWLQIALETLLFYHPAVGWMSRRIREERENCCDDLVVSRCRKPATYARALANLEVLRAPNLAGAAIAATGGNLLSRIRRIVDRELPRTSSGYAQMTLMAALAIVIGLGAHRGVALSQALNRVADVAQLQPSDIAWKTWGRSRAVWGAGLDRYADRIGQAAAAPEPDVPVAAAARLPVAADAVTEMGSAVSTAPQTDAVVTSPATHWTGSAVTAVHESDPDIAAQVSGHDTAAIDLVERTAPPATAPAEPAAGALATAPAPAAPAVLEQVPPRYPWRARAGGLEGFVEIAFSVDERGRAHDIEVREAVPSDIFDRAAIRALKKWKFSPRTAEAPALRLTQTFHFDLEDLPQIEPSRRHCAVTGRRACSLAPPDAIVVYVNPPSDRHQRKMLN